MDSTPAPQPFHLAPEPARRVGPIAPFHVMELVKAADALAASGRSIIHLSIGEPDFTAPPPVEAALIAAVRAGQSAYTPAIGTPALRRAIAAHYRRAHGFELDPQRVVITAGASGALLLVAAVMLDGGCEILMPDPSYPCNRHIMAAFDVGTRAIAVGPEKRFQLDADDVARHWTPRTRGVLLASPSNPTGVSIPAAQLAAVHAEVRRRRGFLVVDEIYHELRYESSHADAPTDVLSTALTLGDDLIVVNSFSKYFNMTGWRLGWLVLPESLVATFEKVAQNLFICPSALAQHAALACFEDASLAIYEQRRREFEARRDFLVPALRQLGFSVPVEPDGAFYVYANVEAFGQPSDALARRLLEEAGVCCVPGLDFGVNAPEHWMRFSYATSMENLQEAIRRMAQVLR